MKKLLSIVTMMLFTLTASAQSLEGEWIAGEEMSKVLNEAIDNDEMKAQLGLSFDNEKNVKVFLLMSAEAEGVGMDMEVVFPGTYSQDGKAVNCNFNKDKADFKITDIKSEDPEMKELLSSPASKAMVLGMIKGMAKEQFAPVFEALTPLCEMFKSFTIVSLSDQALTIETNNTELVFNKK